MKAEEARTIPLELVLNDMGIFPSHKNGNDIFYFAREGDKKTPSFKIDIKINKWYDHGVGTGGNTIDAVMFLKKCDFYDAMKYLEKFENYVITDDVYKANQNKKYINEENKKNYKIISIKRIFSYMLKNYINERAIDFEIANRYLKEIVYKTEKGGEKDFYALGFKNDSIGWEIRNKIIKGNLEGKNITTFNNNSSSLKIFEGYWDFLSFLTINPDQENESDYIILNSVALVDKISSIDEKKYNLIQCYLDNDEAGERTLKRIREIFKGKIVEDCSIDYENYIDLNDWLKENRDNVIRKKIGLL